MTKPLQNSYVGRVATAFGIVLFCLAPTSSGRTPALIREIGRIELPGVSGRIDHLAVDLDGQRLFVAALGADEVEVVDLKAGRRIGQLKGVREPQGVVYLAAARRLFVAAGESEEVIAFEGNQRVAAATSLPDADNMRFFAPTGRVVAGYGSGLAIIDAASLAIVQRITLPAHPEAFELAEHGPEIFVNIPAAQRIVVVDRRDGSVMAQWDVAPEAANFPMVLDEAAHRLYVGTRHPAKLLAFDTLSGRRMFEAALCGDVDDLFLDEARRQLLAICGEGEVDVWSTAAASEPLQRIATAAGARTGLFIASTRTLFVAAPARRAQSAALLIYRVP